MPTSIQPKAACLLSLLVLCGCPSKPRPGPAALAPIPMHQALGIVNHNIAKVGGTLRASGSVDGHFTTPEGRQVRYDLNGILFYLAPTYVRFDLKKFGDRQFLFGSNEQMYWVYTKDGDAYSCGRQGAPHELPADIPARPDQIADAMGLAVVPGTEGASVKRVQRVVDQYQQILFLIRDANGRLLIEKEYWLDRTPPQLIRHVVFRDADGVVEMASTLGDYREMVGGGPLLPREMVAEWPKAGAQMRFRIQKWESVPQVGPTGPQFATPAECSESTGGS